jgi:2-dehydropantoate 2-reductase
MDKRIAVLGTGAIGSALGGQLTRAGHDVAMIDQWPPHVEAMKRDGLHVIIGERDAPEVDYTVPVRAYHAFEVCTIHDPLDIVFLTCKSYDSEWMAQLIKPHLAPDGVLVSVQNSVNTEWVGPIIGPERTMGAVLLGGGELLEPGFVWRNRPTAHRFYAVGEVSNEDTPRLREMAALLADAGRTETTYNLSGTQWSKTVLNCVSAALSALVSPRLRSWDLMGDATYLRHSMAVYREGATVGLASGYTMAPLFGMTAEDLLGSTDDVLQKLLVENSEGHSKGAINMVQQDLFRGRPTEVPAYFNGLVSRKGREAGIPTPINDAVTALFIRLERGEIKQDMSNLALLDEEIKAATSRATDVSLAPA